MNGTDGGFSTPEKYVLTQTLLREFLAKGRGMFPVRKSDPFATTIDQNKKRHSKAAVGFFEQYIKYFN